MTRILIAEDEERIVSFLEKGLRAQGYTTLAVATGIDAAALARDDSFDLVVLDLGLPGRDGRQVLREIRARGERLPVIVLTARDGIDDTVGSLEEGADDYITKPFRFEELLARVRLRLRDEPAQETSVLNVGTVSLDLRSRRATHDQRTIDLTARVLAARVVHAASGPGAEQGAIALSRVGIRLRSWLERRRRVRAVSAPEARRRRDRDRTRDGLSADCLNGDRSG